jgi:O-methyltransferase
MTSVGQPDKRYRRTPVNDIQPGRRYALNKEQEEIWFPDIKEKEFWSIAEEVWDYTVLGTALLYNIYASCKYVFAKRVPGDIVECGVFLGGSIMFFAEMCKRYEQGDRVIYALDTFTGFLRRSELDVDWDGKPICEPTESQNRREEAEENIRSVGWRQDLVQIVEGDVLETAPALPGTQIAILRLDTDTYDTTAAELESLYPRVVPGGVVIIDDYGWGLGQRAAVDEYFRDDPVCLLRIDRHGRAFVKPV